MRIAVTLQFAKGYIAHPYWPERERLITVQKESGLNRARSLDKRQKALTSYLTAKALSVEDYRALELRAARAWYTAADVGLPGDPAEIVIPAHQLHGLMAQAADLAPAAVRLARPEQIRTLLTWEDCRTGRTKADGVWERFVVVKSGTGNTLSNQRGLRSDEYLTDVTAVGGLSLVSADLAPRAKQFIAWAGQEIGVGASRKLGWGRFQIVRWAE
jgi:hypothetical protein